MVGDKSEPLSDGPRRRWMSETLQRGARLRSVLIAVATVIGIVAIANVSDLAGQWKDRESVDDLPVLNQVSNQQEGPYDFGRVNATRKNSERDVGADSKKLDMAEVFRGDALKPSFAGVSLNLLGYRNDSGCSGVARGSALGQIFAGNECSQAVRGMYADKVGRRVALAAILRMRDKEAASRAVDALDANPRSDFIYPLASKTQDVKFAVGYSYAHGYSDGRYVFIAWVQLLDDGKPVRNDAELSRMVVALDQVANVLRVRGSDS